MVSSRRSFPEWWDWELDCSNPHLVKRMIDRSFNETDLREMLEVATAYRADIDPGRWIISSVHNSQPWEIIVEPQLPERVLLVVTAYRVS